MANRENSGLLTYPYGVFTLQNIDTVRAILRGTYGKGGRRKSEESGCSGGR